MTQNERTELLREQIQKMESNGASIDEMIKKLKVSKDVLYYHRRHLKLTGKPKKLNLTIDQRQKIKALVKMNKSYQTVADQFSISASTVRLIVNDNDSISNHYIEDALSNPVNALLSRRWA